MKSLYEIPQERKLKNNIILFISLFSLAILSLYLCSCNTADTGKEISTESALNKIKVPVLNDFISTSIDSTSEIRNCRKNVNTCYLPVYIEETTCEGPSIENFSFPPFIESKMQSDTIAIRECGEIPAKFPGGEGEWRKYLERNLNRDFAADSNVPAGYYTITISFIIDKEGKVTNVQTKNNTEYRIVQEAIRVVSQSPDWIPATRNRKNIEYRHTQKIGIDVAEAEE